MRFAKMQARIAHSIRIFPDLTRCESIYTRTNEIFINAVYKLSGVYTRISPGVLWNSRRGKTRSYAIKFQNS